MTRPDAAGSAAPDRTPTPAEARTERVWTVPAHDELHRGGESLVLLDGQVRRVCALGTVIRERALKGASLHELAAELDACVGAPPGGDTEVLARETVLALLEAGLLSSTPPPARTSSPAAAP